MKTKLVLLSAFLLASALALTLTASAAIPHLMNFQGKATDKTGSPLNGTYNLKFRIYNTETGGTPKWTETQPNIPISNGIFQVQLGSVAPLNLTFNESYWISIEINTDGEMSPRTRLASVGYAYMAETASNSIPPQEGNAGKFLTTDATTASWAAIPHGKQEYTSGSGVWTCPAGVTKVCLTLIGGGGNGAAGSYGIRGGGGGSSGGQIINKLYSVTAGNTYAYSVGGSATATTFGTGTVVTGQCFS